MKALKYEITHTNRGVEESHQRSDAIASNGDGDNMEAVKIIMPSAERKPCVCGATLYLSRTSKQNRHSELWLCSRHCGARGLSYEGALRRKVRLDLLSWGDLRRNAQALIAAEDEEQKTVALH